MAWATIGSELLFIALRLSCKDLAEEMSISTPVQEVRRCKCARGSERGCVREYASGCETELQRFG